MNRIHHILAEHTKDVIAILIVIVWCASIFFPSAVIDEITQRSYERIMIMVLSYYFGSKKYEGKTQELNERGRI